MHRNNPQTPTQATKDHAWTTAETWRQRADLSFVDELSKPNTESSVTLSLSRLSKGVRHDVDGEDDVFCAVSPPRGCFFSRPSIFVHRVPMIHHSPFLILLLHPNMIQYDRIEGDRFLASHLIKKNPVFSGCRPSVCCVFVTVLTASCDLSNVTRPASNLYSRKSLIISSVFYRRCLVSCMDELSTNLGTVFLVRLAYGNVSEVVFPILKVSI